MYKLVVLTCFIAVTLAKPGYVHNHGLKTVSEHSVIPVVKTALVQEPATIAVQEKTITKVGAHVESIPTAVSHQSQTFYHSEPSKITSILAPAVQTRYEPTVRTYEKQYIENVPVVKQYAAPTYAAQSYDNSAIVESSPAIVKSYAAPEILNTFNSQIDHHTYATPTLIKSAPVEWNSYGYGSQAYSTYAAKYAGVNAVKSYAAPAVVQSYATPSVVKSYAAPAVVQSYATPSVVKSYAAPAVVQSYAAPTVLKSYSAPGLLHSYAAPNVVKSIAAPTYFQSSYAAPTIVKSIANPSYLQSYSGAKSYAAPALIQSYAASAPTALIKSYSTPTVLQYAPAKNYETVNYVKSYNAPLAQSTIYRSDLQHGSSW